MVEGPKSSWRIPRVETSKLLITDGDIHIETLDDFTQIILGRATFLNISEMMRRENQESFSNITLVILHMGYHVRHTKVWQRTIPPAIKAMKEVFVNASIFLTALTAIDGLPDPVEFNYFGVTTYPDFFLPTNADAKSDICINWCREHLN